MIGSMVRACPRLVAGFARAMLLMLLVWAPVHPRDLIQIQPTTVRQGQIVSVTIAAEQPLVKPTLRFAGRAWPLHRHGTSSATYLATDPRTKAGRYEVTLEALTAGGAPLRARAVVSVVRVAFPTRTLTFDRQQSILLTPDASERERRRTEAALRVLRDDQLWVGPFLLPVSGPVSSPYGVLNIYQGQVWGFHGGVDLAVPMGTPVQAANDGIVRLAEELPLSGIAVLIDHGFGVVSSYLHLSAIRVTAGQQVQKGEIIGNVGTTGLSLGPHLHWGIRVNGVHVDPLPWTH